MTASVKIGLALLVAVGAMALAACGGSDSTGTGGSTGSNGGSNARTGPKEGGSTSASSADAEGQEPSADFRGKGPNGVLATAGSESTVEEREAASRVLEESLTARAAGDWAGQCETLTATLIKQLEEPGSKVEKKKTCAQAVEAQAKKATEAALENTMVEPLAALRVNGRQAFAFYHGAGGKDYVVPMEKEGGEWKVAALVTQEAP